MNKNYSQAIIPREASRSILLGEASYTLIDDNGIEFYLSPADKKKREADGIPSSYKNKKPKMEAGIDMEKEIAPRPTSGLKDVLDSDPHYIKPEPLISEASEVSQVPEWKAIFCTESFVDTACANKLY